MGRGAKLIDLILSAFFVKYFLEPLRLIDFRLFMMASIWVHHEGTLFICKVEKVSVGHRISSEHRPTTDFFGFHAKIRHKLLPN